MKDKSKACLFSIADVKEQDSKNGKDISDIGLDEQEVMYERNSGFKVLDKVYKDGIWYILMKEVL